MGSGLRGKSWKGLRGPLPTNSYYGNQQLMQLLDEDMVF